MWLRMPSLAFDRQSRSNLDRIPPALIIFATPFETHRSTATVFSPFPLVDSASPARKPDVSSLDWNRDS